MSDTGNNEASDDEARLDDTEQSSPDGEANRGRSTNGDAGDEQKRTLRGPGFTLPKPSATRRADDSKKGDDPEDGNDDTGGNWAVPAPKIPKPDVDTESGDTESGDDQDQSEPGGDDAADNRPPGPSYQRGEQQSTLLMHSGDDTADHDDSPDDQLPGDDERSDTDQLSDPPTDFSPDDPDDGEDTDQLSDPPPEAASPPDSDAGFGQDDSTDRMTAPPAGLTSPNQQDDDTDRLDTLPFEVPEDELEDRSSSELRFPDPAPEQGEPKSDVLTSSDSFEDALDFQDDDVFGEEPGFGDDDAPADGDDDAGDAPEFGGVQEDFEPEPTLLTGSQPTGDTLDTDGDGDFEPEPTVLTDSSSPGDHREDPTPPASPPAEDDDFEPEPTELIDSLQPDAETEQPEAPDTADPPPPEHRGPTCGPSEPDAPPPLPAQQPGEPADPTDSAVADSAEPGAEHTRNEESEEFEADDTELFESPYEHEEVCPRLTTLEGPTTGQEFLVDGLRNSIGRATSNTIAVPDLAMSRQHFEIVRNADDTYEVHDLMSVNGTELNGVDIKKADLFHGDRIAAGNTVFQFLIPGNTRTGDHDRNLVPARPADTLTGEDHNQSGEVTTSQSSSLYDQLLLGVIIGAAVLSLLLLGFLIQATVLEDDEIAEDSPGVLELYDEGLEHVDAGDWTGAEELFQEALELDEDFEPAAAQLGHLEEQRQLGELIEQARQQGAQLDDELADEIRAIPRDNHYYEEAQETLQDARQAEARQLFERAQQAYEDDDFDEANRRIDELLALAPEHEQARRLLEQIDEASHPDDDQHDSPEREDSAGAESEPATEPPPAAPVEPDPEPEPVVAAEGVDEDVDEDDGAALDDPFAEAGDEQPPEQDDDAGGDVGINFIEGFSLYRDGRFDEAIEHFDSIAETSSGAVAERAADTAEDIREFRDSRQQGREALQQGNYQEALESFQSARQADDSVTGGGGSFGEELAGDLAEALAARGQQQLQNEEYASARDYHDRAEGHDPAHPDVNELGDDLEDEAQALHIRAVDYRREGNTSRASDLGETILTMVPPESDIHQRARDLLDDLD